MEKVNEPKIVEVNLNVDGEFMWIKAYVTWEDDNSMRVTPVDGDQLCSIHVDKNRGKGDLYRDA